MSILYYYTLFPTISQERKSRQNEKEASADVVKNGTSYEITVESKKASKVALMNVGAPKQVNGASYTQNGENVIVEFHGDGKAEVVF